MNLGPDAYPEEWTPEEIRAHEEAEAEFWATDREGEEVALTALITGTFPQLPQQP